MGAGKARVRKLTSSVGAVIEGVDLRAPLAPETVSFIRQAFLDSGVVFFHDQDLNADQMRAFSANFGTPIPTVFTAAAKVGQTNPVTEGNLEATKHATAVWHADTTFAPEPPMATALRAVKLPPVGGDTCWSSMYAAYDALSEPMRRMLDGLTAIHSIAPTLRRMGALAKFYGEESRRGQSPEHAHPVVRVHPDTGRKALYVSEAWTTRIVEFTPAESDSVLALLFEHVKSPDFTMRWHWAPNDVAFWDNRCVQHYAVPDYTTERVMQRVELAGDRPAGPA